MIRIDFVTKNVRWITPHGSQCVGGWVLLGGTKKKGNNTSTMSSSSSSSSSGVYSPSFSFVDESCAISQHPWIVIITVIVILFELFCQRTGSVFLDVSPIPSPFFVVFFLVGERTRIIKIRVLIHTTCHTCCRCHCHWCCCCCVIIIFIVFFPLFLINVPLVVSPSVECLLRSWSRSRSNIDRGVGVVVGVKTISLAPLFRWADTIFFILLSH